MPLASADAIRDELGLSVPDAGRVARYLPEAEAYLRVLKGAAWYRALAALPAIVRPPVVRVPEPPLPYPNEEPGPAPVPAAPLKLVVDTPDGGASVGRLFFASGTATCADGVARVQLRATPGGEPPEPWRTVAEATEKAPPVLGWGVEVEGKPGPLVVEVEAVSVAGVRTRAAFAVDVDDAAPAPVDTEGPVVRIDRPAPGSAHPGGSLDVLGRASDPSGVARVEIREDGGRWVDVVTPGGKDDRTDGAPTAVAFAHRVQRPAGGTVVLDVRARDGLGNESLTSVAATILPADLPAPDTSGPEILLDSPRPGAVVGESFVLTGRARRAGGIAALDWRTHVSGEAAGAWTSLGPTSAGDVQAFARSLAGAPGEPLIVEVRARGRDGSESTQAVAVAVRAAESPEPTVPARGLFLDRPTSGAVVPGPVVYVVGSTSDPRGVASVEARLSPAVAWEPVHVPAGLPERVAFAHPFLFAASGSGVVEVRATYGDGVSRSDSVAFVVRMPEAPAGPPPSAPPALSLDRPTNGSTVMPPAFGLVGRAVAAAGATIVRVAYQTDPTDGWDAAMDIPPGQREVVFATDIGVSAGPVATYLTVGVQATDSHGQTTERSAAVRIAPDPDVKSDPDSKTPGGAEGSPERPALWPTGFRGEALDEPADPRTVRPAPGVALPDSKAPAPASAARFAAERAECLLALSYALPVLNLRLSPGGGLVTTSWAREADGGSQQTRYAAPESLDLLRRDLLTSAKLLVDGDVRVILATTSSATGRTETSVIDGIDGLAGGSGFLGVI